MLVSLCIYIVLIWIDCANKIASLELHRGMILIMSTFGLFGMTCLQEIEDHR